MTSIIEDLLTDAMREEAAGLTPAPDLVARAARANRQRTRLRLATSATGVAGVAAAVAISLTGASPGPHVVRPGAAASGSRAPSSPQVRLIAAMTTSAQLSYRLHLVNTATTPEHQMTPTSPPRDLVNWYADYTGVYDPATRLGAGVNIIRLQSGTLASPSTYGKAVGSMQVRIVGDKYYVEPGDGQRWYSGRGSLVQALVLNGGRAWAPTEGASADPAILLAVVRQLGTVTFAGSSGSGAGELDTYDFSYDIAGDSSVKPHLLTGTIEVHGQSNLIAGISMETTVTGANPQLADGDLTTFKTDMTFSDYGVPVSVQAPTGVVPQQSKLLPPPASPAR
jgi:hypothetical protein